MRTHSETRPYGIIEISFVSVRMTSEAVTFPICPYVRNEHTRGSRGAPLGPVIKLRGSVWAFCFFCASIKKSSKTFHDFSRGGRLSS